MAAAAGAGAALGGASREAFEALLSSKDAQLARLEEDAARLRAEASRRVRSCRLHSPARHLSCGEARCRGLRSSPRAAARDEDDPLPTIRRAGTSASGRSCVASCWRGARS